MGFGKNPVDKMLGKVVKGLWNAQWNPHSTLKLTLEGSAEMQWFYLSTLEI